jgi:hypothetical protein
MIPEIEDVLPLVHVAKLWQRASKPRPKLKHVLNALVAAFWRGMLDAPGDDTRLVMLRVLFEDPATKRTLRLVVAGAEADQCTTLPDGSLVVAPDDRPIVPTPEGPKETWDDMACAPSYEALAKLPLSKHPPSVVAGLRRKPVADERFIALLETYYPGELPFLAWCPPGHQLSGGAPEGSAMARPAKVKRASKKYSMAKLPAWHRRYVENCLAEGRTPSQKEDLEAARKEFTGVTRAQMRVVRKTAPKEWHQGGRRKSQK